jgi:hypothetical protein
MKRLKHRLQPSKEGDYKPEIPDEAFREPIVEADDKVAR